jgi:uncharacterized protein (TIGR03118 family)
MSRHFHSLQQVFPGDNARRRPQRHPLMLERLEDRFLLTGGYQQTNLVSDIPSLARHTDDNLHNPWGLIATTDGQVRISDNGTGLSTLYSDNGTILHKVVTIPPPKGSPPGMTAAPTGIVLNTTSDFVISDHHRSRPSTFIFATEDGTLSGWNNDVNRNNAILEVDNSTVPSANNGAVYKGLALGSNAHGNFLFATNFRAGTIDVFDKNFKQVHLAGSFIDLNLPPPPHGGQGFAPFGIENIGGKLFVTYAFQKPGQHDDLSAAGSGFVDVFDTNGNLLRRFASHGTLNSPWSVALAPDDFGQFSHALLVGNFGDGRINAFNLTAPSAFLGQLSDTAGHPISINGLWGITFPKGEEDDDANTLFFAAGINDEADGLFGTLKPADTDASASRPGSSMGRAESAGEMADLVALLPPLAVAPSLAAQSPIAAPADLTTGTAPETSLTPTRLLGKAAVSSGGFPEMGCDWFPVFSGAERFRSFPVLPRNEVRDVSLPSWNAAGFSQ